MFAFVVLGLVSSVLREQIDWEERLRMMLLKLAYYLEEEMTYSA